MLKIIFLFTFIFSTSFAKETPYYFVKEDFEDKFFDKKVMEDGSELYGKIISGDKKITWYNRRIWKDGRTFTEKIEMPDAEYFNVRTMTDGTEIVEKMKDRKIYAIKEQRILYPDGTETAQRVIPYEGPIDMILYEYKVMPDGSKEIGREENKNAIKYNIKEKDGIETIEKMEYKNGDIFYNIVVHQNREGKIVEKCKIKGVMKTKNCVIPSSK